jgi:hypothetical protein
VPQSYLTPIAGVFYELDVHQLKRDVAALLASQEGIVFEDAFTHNAPYTISGDAYDRAINFIAPYGVDFESGAYVIKCTGANHNIADVKSADIPSLIVNNSAGRTIITDVPSPTVQEIDAQLSSTHGAGSWESTSQYEVLQGWTDDPANNRMKYEIQVLENGEFYDASGWTISIVLYETGSQVYSRSGISPDAQGMFRGTVTRAQYTPTEGSSFESLVMLQDNGNSITGVISVSVLSQA